jgi:hypothetical protein
MPPSPSRSPTSLPSIAAWLAALAAAGCSDDPCGPGGAPAVGLTATGAGVNLSYGNLVGGLNNDCPAPDAPAGIVSLTLQGGQSGGTGRMTLCVRRPDLLAQGAQPLGHDVPDAEVLLIDVTGAASGCSFTIDRSQPPTGTATTAGLCGNGSNPAGFALSLDGSVSLTRTCGAAVDSVQLSLAGTVAVTQR